MKSLVFLLIVIACSCNDTATTHSETDDTMPVVKPPVADTSRVVTPPPTGDSNVVHPDTTIQSR